MSLETVCFSEDARSQEIAKKISRGYVKRSRGFLNTSILTSNSINENDYSPLYIILANEAGTIQREAMMSLRRNDRNTAWNSIVEGYRRCPLLILRKAFELNDCTCPMPPLVYLARRVQDKDFSVPESTYESNEFDNRVVRWWYAYAAMDSMNWILAHMNIILVLEDFQNGFWSMFYLPEALYMSAVIQFNLGEKESCRAKINEYFSFAHPLDRNYANAKLLSLWAYSDCVPSLYILCEKSIMTDENESIKQNLARVKEQFEIPKLNYHATLLEIQTIDAKLSEVWDDDTFLNACSHF